jgi:hypothetical protein
MTSSLITRPPQTHCYKCGSSQSIGSVCHHCGRLMCADHSPRVVDGRDRPLSAEFSGLDLEHTKSGVDPVHCENCQHFVRSQQLWMNVGGAASALAGLLVLILMHKVGLGLLVFALGVGLAVCGETLNRWRADAARRSRPVLPLLPRFDRVRVRETLEACITLDREGRYRTTAKTVTGRLTIAATFGKADRDRVQWYRRKYELAENRDIDFHLGFAVLRGRAALASESGFGPNDERVLPLTGRVREYPFLNGESTRATREWRRELEYEVRELPGGNELPVSLTPSVVQAAGRRALDLDLQWTEFPAADTRRRPAIDRIESLELHVPMTWGEVRHVEGNAVLGISDEADAGQAPSRTIRWLPQVVASSERRWTFAVRFDNPIDFDCAIRGRLEVSLKGAMSGLQGIDLYHPLGFRRSHDPATIRTRVVVEFELSLAGIRYQDIRIVPDAKLAADADKRKTIDFEGVVPDHRAIIALTSAISGQGYFVKRVLENPPSTGGRANLVNRFWDIAGRTYRGVYPVDFHLVVTGEEIYNGNVRAEAGTTTTTLFVRGAFASPEMQARVEGVWYQLRDLINETLRKLPRVAPADAAGHPQPGEAAADPDGRARDHRAERIEALRQLKAQIEEELQGLLEEDWLHD